MSRIGSKTGTGGKYCFSVWGLPFRLGSLIYKNWGKIVTWVKETLGPLFAPIGEAWGRFVAWAGNLWDNYQD